MSTVVGFVGLGAMGMPMAQNLVKAGFAVRGFDQRPGAAADLAAAGGGAAASAADAAAGADVLVLMVVNAAQAQAVLFDAGALEALPTSACVILMATCPPQQVEALAARVLASGRRFLDAPVSGGTAGARAATLSIMVGGARETFEQVRPVLATLGDKLFHVGEQPGMGATLKTLNQLLCGVHLAAAAEAMALARRLGVDQDLAQQILGGSAAASWMLRDRGPRMLKSDPPVTSAVDIFVKDLGIVLEAGAHARAPLPLAAIAHQLFLAVSGQGKCALDDSQVIQAYGVAPPTPSDRT